MNVLYTGKAAFLTASALLVSGLRTNQLSSFVQVQNNNPVLYRSLAKELTTVDMRSPTRSQQSLLTFGQPKIKTTSGLYAKSDDQFLDNDNDVYTNQLLVSFSSSNIILSPLNQSPDAKQFAIAILPGTDIHPSQYKALGEAIQGASSHAIWIYIPRLPLNMGNPISTQVVTEQALAALKNSGFNGHKIMLAGHSLSGIFLPMAMSKKAVAHKISASILLGSYTLRDDRNKDGALHHIPRLTISGDLDGLTRVGRIAEDYYHHISKTGASNETKLNYPIVLIEGMNHMQFATGEASLLVKARDLQPEIEDHVARSLVAETIAEFIDTQEVGNQTAQELLISKVNRTESYVTPIINAMKVEGNYHIEPPCHLSNDEECTLGSKWVAMAQSGLAQVNSATLDVQDEFQQTWQINFFSEPHFFHPKIDPNSAMTKNGLPLKVKTVSELIYERLDSTDNAICSNMPKEIRVKFNSRQAILKALGQDIPFSESEIPDICSKLNARTIQWALEQAPIKAKERYLERGVKLVAGYDKVHKAGPAWIWSYLEYESSTDDQGKKNRQVNSHSFKAPLDHLIPYARGKHYCKLLSPSKALDWIYTDSLRE